jgi:hypothetical protein
MNTIVTAVGSLSDEVEPVPIPVTPKLDIRDTWRGRAVSERGMNDAPHRHEWCMSGGYMGIYMSTPYLHMGIYMSTPYLYMGIYMSTSYLGCRVRLCAPITKLPEHVRDGQRNCPVQELQLPLSNPFLLFRFLLRFPLFHLLLLQL